MPAHASRTLAPAPSAPPSRAERRLLAPVRPRHRPASAATPAELSASPAARPVKLRSVDSGSGMSRLGSCRERGPRPEPSGTSSDRGPSRPVCSARRRSLRTPDDIRARPAPESDRHPAAGAGPPSRLRRQTRCEWPSEDVAAADAAAAGRDRRIRRRHRDIEDSDHARPARTLVRSDEASRAYVLQAPSAPGCWRVTTISPSLPGP